ncbi:tRNA (adenosine(37)-N6)-threonylcarbamoyltransferase complex transferase subunit TsaD [Candidatus Saccharibacteria bacterium RIFCSPHIGHO2_12_FULL_41_12]|nr:MAG: tRNA (adenosine(37)-N6)-threonylcarbamoyltransferase complex transferase subunit TsaD [Candidatus Saccharibacteria bacterium RIFCSPHIGHO2_12_FULL_41_12]
MLILGIETSCDETAVAIVKDGCELLSNVVASSMDLQAQYGGIVPEVAARAQIEYIIPVLAESMKQAGCTWTNIDAVAVTYGPGLGGSLLVGVMTAKTLGQIYDKPLIPVDHVQAHMAVNFLTKTSLNYHLPKAPLEFPALCLIVSGGHSQIVYYLSPTKYEVLGKTRDDAVGEAFDKVAKILGLPYPGGPSISKLAKQGDQKTYQLPKSRLENPYDFSFSGLKTAVLRLSQQVIGKDYTFPSLKIAQHLSDQQKADIAASFEYTAIETLLEKLIKAEQEFASKNIVITGGVSANQYLRTRAKELFGAKVHSTDPKLSTDNGAMIASQGSQIYMKNKKLVDYKSLQIEPSLQM